MIRHKQSTIYALMPAVLLALVAGAFVGCSKEPEQESDPVALVVNGMEIRVSELQAQIDQWNSQGGIRMDLDQFVERYVTRTIAVKEAFARGLHEDLEIRHQYENMLIGRLRRDEFERRSQMLSISEEAVVEHYEASITDYTKPAQVRIALLQLDNSRDATAVRARLQEAADLAKGLPKDTRGFGALAINYSEEGTSRFKGGDVGWMQAGMARYRWPDEVVTASFELSEKGELSNIIETETASYLLMKLDGRPEVVQPLDQSLASRIHRQLLAEQNRELKALIESEWADGREVVTHPQALSQLNFSLPESNDRPEGPDAFSSLSN